MAPSLCGWRLTQAGKDLGSLLLDCQQRARVEAEQVQDRRRDLGRLHRLAGGFGVDLPGRPDEDWYVAVGRVVAAVFGDLAAAGVDDADLDAAEHVRVARIRG